MPAGTSASSNDCSFSSSSSPETSMHRFSLGCQVHFPFWRFKRRQRPETNGIYPDRHLIEFRCGFRDRLIGPCSHPRFIKRPLFLTWMANISYTTNHPGKKITVRSQSPVIPIINTLTLAGQMKKTDLQHRLTEIQFSFFEKKVHIGSIF